VFRIGSDITVQFVFIDTELLITSDKGCSSSNDTDPQWVWIEKTLAASTSQWLFVLGHHPGKKELNIFVTVSMKTSLTAFLNVLYW